MRRWFVVLSALLLAVPPVSLAKPLDPALQQQLLARFESYNQAIDAGKLQDALAIRTAETRANATKEMRTAKGRQEFLA